MAERLAQLRDRWKVARSGPAALEDGVLFRTRHLESLADGSWLGELTESPSFGELPDGASVGGLPDGAALGGATEGVWRGELTEGRTLTATDSGKRPARWQHRRARWWRRSRSR